MPDMIYRRRFTLVEYPSLDQWVADKYRPEAWDQDFHDGGFWVRILANPNGHDVRTEAKLRAEFLFNPNDETRKAYHQELAWRVVEWNYVIENRDGVIAPVPAPGEIADNWEVFGLLPPMVASWLSTEIERAHVPKAIASSSDSPGTPDTPSVPGPMQEP